MCTDSSFFPAIKHMLLFFKFNLLFHEEIILLFIAWFYLFLTALKGFFVVN